MIDGKHFSRHGHSHVIDLNSGRDPRSERHSSTTVFCCRLRLIKPPSIHSNIMRLQTSLLSLFLLALVFASYVDASAKKKKKNNKSKKVSILSDKSTGRGDVVTLPLSPVLKSKPKSKPASVLVDTTNIAPAVQLKDQDILVQSVPEESQVPERDEQTKKFGELISKEQYEEIAELGKGMSDEELLKCLCQVVTNLDHFKGLYEYLKQRKMVPSFLAHGEMALVKKVIVETDLLKTVYDGMYACIFKAIALSLKNDCHEHVVGLFEAARERPAWKDEFDIFVSNFFLRCPPKENSVPLKRFLSFYREELGEKHSDIFETICGKLVGELGWRPSNLVSRKLLIDLTGQQSLLTPVASARGFLMSLAINVNQANFIQYGYKEALEEGLKKEYEYGGRKLWAMMVSTLPTQFSGEYPSTDEARIVALKNFKPTKQDLEEEWAKRNALKLQMKLEMLVPDLLPTVLLGIVSEYAVTWIAFLWSPPQSQLRPQISERVAEKFEALMSGKRYGDVVEFGNSMEKDTLAKYLCPLMTTTEHCMYLNGYLDSRGMTPHFLMLGEMEIVRKAILEFKNTDSDYYILDEHVWDAITLSIKEHRDGRAISLLRTERERHATADEQRKLMGKKTKLEVLLKDFSIGLLKKMDAAPLKRFLTIHKEELDEGWPNIFEIVCQGMVSRLSSNLRNPDSRKLLTDFVGQPSLITTTAFVNGVFEHDDCSNVCNFISYGWREAIEEGLKEKYRGGGKTLWEMVVHRFPAQFSGEYPSTNGARGIALKDFKPTKQELEEAWAKESAPIFLLKLEEKLQEADISVLLPTVLWNIVVKYAATGATWVDV